MSLPRLWLPALALAAIAHGASEGMSAPSGTRRLEFTAKEGTFISFDVSPDGRTLLFDLLGDLYVLPVAGGTATVLLGGPDWDQSPRFSPDGRMVAFVSDRSGVDSVWTLDLETHALRQMTRGDVSVAGIPAWFPDGRRLAFAMRSITSRLQTVSRASGAVTLLEPHALGIFGNLDPQFQYQYVAQTSPTIAPDGKRVFFSEVHWIHPRPGFRQGCRNVLVQLDLTDGAKTVLTDLGKDHDESDPQLSRSGRLLAYYRRYGNGAAELRVRDLHAQTDHFLADLPGADDPYRWGDRSDEMPAVAFTPDDEALIAAIEGKPHRISVRDGRTVPIPFSVPVALDLRARATLRRRLVDGPLEVRAIRWPSISRDSRRLTFSAVGSVWVQDLPAGEPRRLTAASDVELMPALSPDGRQVVYVAFSDGPRGRLMIADVARGAPRLLLGGEQAYSHPTWSMDGRRVAFVREGAPSGSDRDPRESVSEYGWLDASTGAVTIAATVPSRSLVWSPYSTGITFSSDGRNLLCTGSTTVTTGNAFTQALASETRVFSVPLASGPRRDYAIGGRNVYGVVPSPDGRWAAFLDGNDALWVAALSTGEGTVSLEADTAGATRVTRDATTFLSWQGRDQLLFGSGGLVRRFNAADRRLEQVHQVRLQVPRHQGKGALAFRNARVLTVSGETGVGPILENATVVLQGRRIASVGPSGMTPIPAGAEVIDAAGLTILPGFHDAHYHTIGQGPGMQPTPEDRSAIAYGLTSAWDALTGFGDTGLAAAEMRDAGRLRGPRWFFAGRSIEHYLGQVPSAEEARDKVRRRAATGVELLKDYDTIDRRTRQWFADAARAEGLGITAHFEGLHQGLARVLDGYTGLEHARYYGAFQEDVLELLARTGTILTPHLLLADGSSSLDGEPIRRYFMEVQQRKPAQITKLKTYGRATQYAQWLCPTAAPLERLRAMTVARSCAQLIRLGGKVAVSGHNGPAILAHVEMWLLWKGGVPAGEVIRSATRTGVERIGYDRDLGSIEAGKTADFVVLDSDPLEDILNTLDVRYTVADGVVYEASTLKQVWPPTGS